MAVDTTAERRWRGSAAGAGRWRILGWAVEAVAAVKGGGGGARGEARAGIGGARFQMKKLAKTFCKVYELNRARLF